MKFDIIVKTARSITIELNNKEQVYTKYIFNIYLNDQLVLEEGFHNVVSLYDLLPNTRYQLKLIEVESNIEEIIEFTTENELVTLNVKKFGAKGDGIHNDTTAIQTAILACPDKGRVLIEKGEYLVSALFLRSNITIEIKKDARLLGIKDRELYPVLPGYITFTDESDEYNLGSWEGNPLDSFASLITGINVENVNIIGEGILDGQASIDNWWDNTRLKRIAWRPRMVFLNNCKNITLQGLTVQNSPAWTLHPYFSSYINFIDLKVINPADSPNTDGLDPESCDHLNIIGVNFSVGDDCIAIKAGKVYMGKKHKRPSTDFIIRNCHMKFGHGAVVLGSEMSGGIQNIHTERCIFTETDRGLRIKTRRGRGEDAIIKNITFENIKMEGVYAPFTMNMFYYCDPDGKTEYVWSKESLPLNEWTPYLGDFHFKDIVCEDTHWAAGFFYGLPEQKIKEINMENITVRYAKNSTTGSPAMMTDAIRASRMGIYAHNVEKINLKNIKIEGYDGELFTIENVDQFNNQED